MAEIAARLAGAAAPEAARGAVAGALEEVRDNLVRYPNSSTLWGHITRRETESAGVLVLGVAPVPATSLSAGVVGDSVGGVVTLGPAHVGPEGAAHGGVIATLFDELLAQLHPLIGPSQIRTAWLRIDYLAPVPLGTPVSLTGRITRQDGRAIEAMGEIRKGEDLLATASGRFVALRNSGESGPRP